MSKSRTTPNAEQHGECILETASRPTTELPIDEEMISLSPAQVAQIFETFDHPPAQSVAAVRKLLTERSILDD